MLPNVIIPRGAGQRRSAFTLAEMMVVVAIIALLAAMLVPALHEGFSVAHEVLCKNNLYHIAQTLHENVKKNAQITSGYNWLGTALGQSDESKNLVWCPSDTRDQSAFSPDAFLRTLRNDRYYELQYNTNSQTNLVISYVADMFTNKPIRDPQAWAWYPAGGVMDTPKGDGGWPPGTLPNLKQNQAFIGVDNDGAVLITYTGSTITFQDWKPPDFSLTGYSRQFINKGAGTPPSPLPGYQKPEDKDDTMIIEMYGWDHKNYDDKVTVSLGAQTSYGINGLVTDRNWRPSQFLVMDANELVVNPLSNSTADLLDEALVPRHHGKLNVATCDGSVKSMTVLDMQLELDKSNDHWKNH